MSILLTLTIISVSNIMKPFQQKGVISRMYKNCTSPETAQRQRYLEQIFQQMLKNKDYHAINIREFCSFANVPRGMFYRYFDSKTDILHAMIDHTLIDYAKFRIDFPLPQDVNPEHIRIFYYWHHQKELLDALSRSNLFGVFFERCLLYAEKEDFSLHHVVYSGKTDDSEALSFAITGIATLVVQWYHSGFKKTELEMAHTLQRLLYAPIFH